MNARNEISYRLALADGFQREAEEDFRLERWRSCVDNAQLALENAGKAVLALFGAPPKTHDPARELAALLRSRELPGSTRLALQQLLPELLALGPREHFLTDYGDEATYTLPWELFTRESAEGALTSSRRGTEIAREITAKPRQEPE
ncbi:MAG: HEPN domain-containing protein [Deltaproteobacteria bacterium]|nr:HEPN domain-containing protein [Deltaproteobacteria bacterium]